MYKPRWVISRALLLDNNDFTRRAGELASKGERDSGTSWEQEEVDSHRLDEKYFRRDKKRQKYLDLVERFYRQLRYGCGKPECKCYLCHTYKSTLAQDTPYRRPTPSSARAISVLLASADDPYRNLCSHLSYQGDQSDLALPASKHLDLLRKQPWEPTSFLDRCLATDRELRELAEAYAQELPKALFKQVEGSTKKDGIKMEFDTQEHNTENIEDADVNPRIDPKSFIQLLFNTSAWKMGKVIQTRDGRYGLLHPPSPRVPSTPVEGILSEKRERDSMLLSVILSPSSTEQQLVSMVADRLNNDLGTFEALFTLFGTKGCPPSVVEPGKMFYTIDQAVEHFTKVCRAMRGSELLYLTLYEDCTIAYANIGLPSSPVRSHLGHSKAAHVVNVCLSALLSSVPHSRKCEDKSKDAWQTYLELTKSGQHLPLSKTPDLQLKQEVIEWAWYFQEPRHIKLVRRILRIVASRSYLTSTQIFSRLSRNEEFIRPTVNFLDSASASGLAANAPRILLEWARTTFEASWNNEPVFSWSSDIGCAIELMRILYEYRQCLGISIEDFVLACLVKRLEMMEVPIGWMKHRKKANHDHLLSFPWLFGQSTIVTYFRVINRSKMLNAVHTSTSLRTMSRRPFRLHFLVTAHERQINERLEVATRDFLTLTIRRDNILDDALNELFRRQRRELQRPLKIRMGMLEGEEGVDLGGIQQEFFRLALGEALDPLHGIFTMDETTRMSWFHPGSNTPQHQQLLIGLLVGLAVYNGITLSVTFPLALYRKLLGKPVDKLRHVEDGWPSLARGFKALLDYDKNDVEDVFMRSYVFSTEANGLSWNFDMDKSYPNTLWSQQLAYEPDTIPSEVLADSSAEQAKMVTNENREQFVSDYIYWLTEKSVQAEYDAFQQGFFMCVDKKTLKLFSPESLRSLVEGIQEIDVAELRKATTYEGEYSSTHPLILDFWEVVQSFSPSELQKLLEFVTASDRVPVKGVSNIAFSILKNGEGDDRLPTSLTCFSRLLLPEYSNKEVLETKLRQAIDNSLAFGLP